MRYRRSFSTAVAIAACLLATACSSTAPPEAAEQQADTAAETVLEEGADLTPTAERWVGDAPGGVAVLVHRDGAVSRTAAGSANSAGDPVDPADTFRVGSISKTFIATMVMQMVDEGSVHLDAPITNYVDDVTMWGDITVAELLSHRSGIPNYTETPAFFEMIEDFEREYEPAEVLDFVDGQDATAYASFSYSNTNYILLGLLVEQVDGQPLNESLTTRIVEPAGLANTRFAVADSPNPDAAPWSSTAGLAGDPTGQYDSVATGAWAAGSLISTVDDLSLFLDALFDGRLLPDESLEAMTDVGDAGYGFGILEAQFSFDQSGFGHSGSIFGYTSTMAIDPDTGDRIVIITNNDSLVADALAQRILGGW